MVSNLILICSSETCPLSNKCFLTELTESGFMKMSITSGIDSFIFFAPWTSTLNKTCLLFWDGSKIWDLGTP